MWDECNCVVVWTLFGIAFLWHWNKNTFSSPVTTAEFSKFAGILSEAWSSLTEIPSPPLTWFAVMLPKACLTSDSRMFGSRWVITPLWLSGSLRSFLYSSSVYSCHLFLISSDFPCGSAGKESACNVEDLGSIPGLGRSPEEGNSYPLQYSGLENSIDSTVHGLATSWTWLLLSLSNKTNSVCRWHSLIYMKS